MANINSLMSNSTSGMSSLYGTRNVLSGLASGMDTEAMIENSISGYKTKITQLEKEQTKYQWKQDAYRSITDKMHDLTEKYTSYTSKTNLYSPSYFNSSISTTPVGNNADAVSKISATGRSSSDIQILAAQAATAASYNISAKNLGLNGANTVTSGMTLSGADIPVGTLKGTMTLNYDGQKIDLDFNETDLIGNGANETTLVDAIKAKLDNATINTSYGTKKASEVIGVDTSGGNITFTDLGNRGASPYISSIGGNLASKLGATSSELYTGSSTKKYTISGNSNNFTENQTIAEYLSSKDINVTVDGVTKSFRLNVNDITSSSIKQAFQDGLDSIGANIKVNMDSTSGQLTFSTSNTSSNFSISTKDSEANRLWGFGDGISNFLSDKSSIGTLLGSDFPTQVDKTGDNGEELYELKINNKSIYVEKNASLESVLAGINNSDMGVKASYSKLTGKFTFTATETGASGKISFDNDLAQSLFTTGNGDPRNRTLKDVLGLADGVTDFTLKLGGKTIGTFNASNNIQAVMDVINDKTETTHGIKGVVEYDSNAGKFYNVGSDKISSSWNFSAYDVNDTRISSVVSGTQFFRNTALIGENRTAGTDATVRAMVNGEAVTLTRASNEIDMDGMKVTLKGNINDLNATDAENKANAVSFKTTGGSDDLVKTITGFVDEYNALLKELHDAYATQPAEKSSTNHTRYEPLTDDDKKDMSDKAIENYEAKAKQGILFGDSDLRAAYESLVHAISPGGNDGAALRDMGIETTYSGGLTQIKLNENKLREKLDTDPDSVRNAFTKSKEGGASTDGLMTSIKNTLEHYGSTSYSTPGILVKKAGSTYNSSSLLNNDMQKQLDSVQKKIEQWQSKMSSKIDYYTRQFTALEKLMNTMNSQSSALAGLMGG